MERSDALMRAQNDPTLRSALLAVFELLARASGRDGGAVSCQAYNLQQLLRGERSLDEIIEQIYNELQGGGNPESWLYSHSGAAKWVVYHLFLLLSMPEEQFLAKRHEMLLRYGFISGEEESDDEV
jgi:hypothetical protein